MKNILQSKAAGFWVALVLTMGPALVAFLVSNEASWITGALHAIDGGRAITSLR